MASTRTVTLVCDRCDREETTKRKVKTHTLTVDKGAPTEIEACDKCWVEVMDAVREMMDRGRKIRGVRRSRK